MSTNIPVMLTVIEAAGRAGVSVLMWGEPGTGKSSLIKDLARGEGLPCEVVYGSQSEPTEYNGLPWISDDGVRLQAPAWARRLCEAEDGGYLLLEELSTATPSTQKAMLGTALDKTVGELRLPGKVRIIAAANDPDSAADGWDLEPPLANRFLHVDYAPAVEDWLDGVVAGFPRHAIHALAPLNDQSRAVARATVSAFIRHRPALLHDMPQDTHRRGRAWPSRRTWTMLADILAQATTKPVIEMAAQGLVGEGAAAEFITWLDQADLPDPQTLLDDPETFDWSGLSADRVWAVLSGAVALCTSQGTKVGWNAGWAPLAAAAENGHAAVAAACSRSLMLARPSGAKPPASAKRFLPALQQAGLA